MAKLRAMPTGPAVTNKPSWDITGEMLLSQV